MPVVQIQILSKTYQLSCEEGDDGRIRSLSQQLQQRLQTLSTHAIGSSDALLMVMAMLMMQDELNEWENTPKDLDEGGERALTQAIDRVSSRLEALAENLASR